ncbi:hypothetical protein [Deinococcus sonorensis]|uniref:Lipoprotein n=2 Tax=Deinococcus sonorensis TaxID=309891 RepID=A0AAU7UBC5_9DEIO
MTAKRAVLVLGVLLAACGRTGVPAAAPDISGTYLGQVVSSDGEQAALQVRLQSQGQQVSAQVRSLATGQVLTLHGLNTPGSPATVQLWAASGSGGRCTPDLSERYSVRLTFQQDGRSATGHVTHEQCNPVTRQLQPVDDGSGTLQLRQP